MRRARNPLGAIVGFAIHLGVFLAGSVFFYTLNQQSESGKDWWYWPVFGWGIGVAFHALGTIAAILSFATGGVLNRGPLAAVGGLIAHIFAYVIVIGALFGMNTLSGTRTWWIYPAIGWGIGLFFHVAGTAVRLARWGLFASRG